jgi:hypothetical protein
MATLPETTPGIWLVPGLKYNVMPGFMPGIHVLLPFKDMDGRNKSGHDTN